MAPEEIAAFDLYSYRCRG